MYVEKTKLDSRTTKHAQNGPVQTSVPNQKKGKGKGTPVALAASLEQQCPYWLTKSGCWNSGTCQKGRHDPEWKRIKDRKPGKGNDPAQPIARQPGKGKGEKGDKKGGKGNEKGGKGDKNKQNVAAPGAKAQPGNPPKKGKLADDAITDNKGRPLC